VTTNPLDTILGRSFAVAGSEQQATLLNAAGDYARRTYAERHDLEMQACFVADHLTDAGWEWIRQLTKFDPKREVTP